MKAILWCIAAKDGSGCFTDDSGGNMFVSEEMARRTMNRHKLWETCEIHPCGLDDDLAQLGDLYHEGNNRGSGSGERIQGEP